MSSRDVSEVFILENLHFLLKNMSSVARTPRRIGTCSGSGSRQLVTGSDLVAAASEYRPRAAADPAVPGEGAGDAASVAASGAADGGATSHRCDATAGCEQQRARHRGKMISNSYIHAGD